ncbi:MAG TPA: RNA polymerase sigma factor SigF, partial [Streptomyces sp.]|nr:RNA polymerase sigma factor SigF [Streptomyces sp.]
MTTTVQVAERTTATAMPEVADPSKVAPADARELSKLFFAQLATLEEG